MNLDESQKKTVSAWITDGLKLADIQKRLGTELGVNLTYMEVRMLVDDLKLMPKDPVLPKVETPVPPPEAPSVAEKPIGAVHAPHRVKELVLANGHPVLPRAFELREDAPHLLETLRFPLDAQPSLASRHADIERRFEMFEQGQVVCE